MRRLRERESDEEKQRCGETEIHASYRTIHFTLTGVAARTDSPRGCEETTPPSPKKSPGPMEATLQTQINGE